MSLDFAAIRNRVPLADPDCGCIECLRALDTLALIAEVERLQGDDLARHEYAMEQQERDESDGG